MNQPPASIPVLRFQAGPLRLGIAAEDVQGVVSAREEIPHIATIFGVEPSGGELGTRAIHVALPSQGGIESFVFAADAPVQVVGCLAENVLPMASGTPIGYWRPVMGFAHIEGETLMLLDTSSLAETLLRPTDSSDERGQSR